MSVNDSVKLEICVDSVDGAIAAEQGGADRLELCGNLLEGGTTPSIGMVRRVIAATSLPVMVMIRPRGGHFQFSVAEQQVMLCDAEAVLAERVAGIVIGATDVAGCVDTEICERLRRLAAAKSVTFHRAFDQMADPFVALATLIELGVDRILTSGQAPRAMDGTELISQLVRQASGALSIMPGCGVRADNVHRIICETGVKEVHCSAGRVGDRRDVFWRDTIPMSATTIPHDLVRRTTSREQVQSVKRAIQPT